MAYLLTRRKLVSLVLNLKSFVPNFPFVMVDIVFGSLVKLANWFSACPFHVYAQTRRGTVDACIYTYINVYKHTFIHIHTYLNQFVLTYNPVSPNSVWCARVPWLKMRSCHPDLGDSDPTVRNSEVTSLFGCIPPVSAGLRYGGFL